MRLPSLSAIIVSQAIIWCFAGAYVHGLVILLYPAAWALIAAAFWFHGYQFPMFPRGTETSEPRGNFEPSSGVISDLNRNADAMAHQNLAAAD